MRNNINASENGLQSTLRVLIGSAALLISTQLLSGCTTYSTQFDCKPGKGMGCKSITEVDHVVDQRQLLAKSYPSQGNILDNSPTPLTTAQNLPNDHRKLRVWIAPYKDANGNWHESSVIYTTTNKLE